MTTNVYDPGQLCGFAALASRSTRALREVSSGRVCVEFFDVGQDSELALGRPLSAQIEEMRGSDPELAAKLRIEERELDAGGLN